MSSREDRLEEALTQIRRGCPNPREVAFRALTSDGSEPSMIQIAREVAEEAGLSSWRELRSHRRNRPLVRARQLAMWRCRTETAHSLPAIGRLFGFDHTTVFHAVMTVERRRG